MGDDCNENDQNKTLGLLFAERMKKHENEIAQIVADTDETDTYGELLKRSIRTAINLRNKNGIKPGDVIGLCTTNHKNSCLPIIAGQLLGAINANFDFNLTHTGMINLLKLIEPKVMFIEESGLDYVQDCLAKSDINVELIVFGKSDKYPTFDEYLKPSSEEETFKPDITRNNKETALILFSSGTTGEPKGICLSHYSIVSQYIEPLTKAVYLWSSSLYWISAVSLLIRGIFHGLSRVIFKKCVPANVWKQIEKYKVNCLFMIPHLAAEFVETRPENVDISSLTTFLTGASLVPKNLIINLQKVLPGVWISQAYGQTEAGGLISTFDPRNPKEIELQKKYPTSCGIVLETYQWKVVDPDTEEVLGPNKPGEIRVKSDFLMNGYYKMDSSHVYDAEGYLKTGDLVYYNEDNCLFIVDRIKEMFKCKGTHIIPLQLEEVLLQHPSVKEAIVVGVPHERDEHHSMGVVTLKDNNDKVIAEDIEKFVEERVYDSQRLRGGVKIVKELHKTPTGKLNRKLIKETLLNLL